MYIGQRTQAWQPVYCIRPGIFHQVALNQVALNQVPLPQVVLHRVILHRVILHRLILHRRILLFDDAEVFAIGFGVVLDYLPDRSYFRLFCSLIKSLNSWQSGIALGMYRACRSLHCRLTMSDSIFFGILCVLSVK